MHTKNGNLHPKEVAQLACQVPNPTKSLGSFGYQSYRSLAHLFLNLITSHLISMTHPVVFPHSLTWRTHLISSQRCTKWFGRTAPPGVLISSHLNSVPSGLPAQPHLVYSSHLILIDTPRRVLLRESH